MRAVEVEDAPERLVIGTGSIDEGGTEIVSVVTRRRHGDEREPSTHAPDTSDGAIVDSQTGGAVPADELERGQVALFEELGHAAQVRGETIDLVR
jgi:hypothetical protein